LLGCVDAGLVEPWPLVVAEDGTQDEMGSLLESRLVPYEYGRVLSIEQHEPEPRTLRRRSGGWLVVDEDGRREVSEDEVYRWYGDLHALEVEAPSGELPAREELSPQHELLIETDSTQTLQLVCERRATLGRDAELWCARDEAPPLRVVGRLDDLAFDANTFADRRLLTLRAQDVRALEILPGPESSGVRQSVHQDLGVWRLDAPMHPDGDGGLDELRLESLMSALASARARDWVGLPEEAPIRTIRVDLAPSGEGPTEQVIALYRGCVAVVGDPGQQELRPARLDEGPCATLAGDLLFDDPLRYWLRNSRSVQIEDQRETRRLVRRGERWEREDGRPLEVDDERLVEALEDWRSQGIREGQPPGRVERTVTIRRNEGPTVTLELGVGWARVLDASWWYERVDEEDEDGGAADEP
jgi:hypothetical protein